jgi:hypothetical protein
VLGDWVAVCTEIIHTVRIQRMLRLGSCPGGGSTNEAMQHSYFGHLSNNAHDRRWTAFDANGNRDQRPTVPGIPWFSPAHYSGKHLQSPPCPRSDNDRRVRCEFENAIRTTGYRRSWCPLKMVSYGPVLPWRGTCEKRENQVHYKHRH